MGIFDKIMFWKKSDDLEEPPEFGADDPFAAKDDFGMSKAPLPEAKPSEQFPPASPTGMQDYGSLESKPPVAPVQPAQAPTTARDTELILARLDSIKVTLDNINMRIEKLERIAKGDEVVYR